MILSWLQAAVLKKEEEKMEEVKKAKRRNVGQDFNFKIFLPNKTKYI